MNGHSIYILSAGPLYHYLIAPITAILGYSYYAYKKSDGFARLQAIFPHGKVDKKLNNYGDVVYLEYAVP